VFSLVSWSAGVYARRHGPDMPAANHINLDVFIPALIFDVRSGKDFAVAPYLDLAAGAAAVVLGSGVIAFIVSRVTGRDHRTPVPPMMFNNSGNMGLPLAVLACGEQAIPAVVVVFLVENLLHFTHGVHLTKADWSHWRVGLPGALLRPVAGRAAALPVLALLPLPAERSRQLILVAVLPPAVLNYVLAERYRQEPETVASIVIWGNLASLVTIPLTAVASAPPRRM
jgi:predicted permease